MTAVQVSFNSVMDLRGTNLCPIKATALDYKAFTRSCDNLQFLTRSKYAIAALQVSKDWQTLFLAVGHLPPLRMINTTVSFLATRYAMRA